VRVYVCLTRRNTFPWQVFGGTYTVTVICCGKVNFGLICATQQVENPVGLRIIYLVSSYLSTPFSVTTELDRSSKHGLTMLLLWLYSADWSDDRT
jgi:hypothetical protein